jgi:hypothetical protein
VPARPAAPAEAPCRPALLSHTLAAAALESGPAADTATNRVKATTYVGRAPHEAFYNKAGTEVWVSIRGEDFIQVLSATTYQTIAKITVRGVGGGGARGAARATARSCHTGSDSARLWMWQRWRTSSCRSRSADAPSRQSALARNTGVLAVQ